MKIFTLTLFLLTPLFISGMQAPKHKKRKQEYIKLHQSSVATSNVLINSHQFRFYKEYHAEHEPENFILFPLKKCDPIEINTVGSAKFFITSAINGKCFKQGTMIYLPSEYTNVVAVRGKFDSQEPVVTHFYIGYNSEHFTISSNRKIYEAHFLATVSKNTRWIDLSGDINLYSGARGLQTLIVGEDVKNRVPAEFLDYDWNSVAFQEQLAEIYDKKSVIKRDCFLLSNPNLMICYWDHSGNRLKPNCYQWQKDKSHQ